ncbi:MAG TPA: NAD(P)-binding protein, partial [Polyangiaceae bacterium]
MASSSPIRVAIIGGGCAGVAAAFELSRPEHGGRYEITIFQTGWRLGGKGASGRGPADRIEEHGLHLWMGFYENAFRLMRECYSELGREQGKHPIADWTDAFVPDPFCGVMDRSPSGQWSPWTVMFPATPGLPGDPESKLTQWTVSDYLRRSITLVRTLLETIQASLTGGALGPDATHGAVGAAPGELTRMMSLLMGVGGIVGLGGLIQGLRVLDEVVRLMPRFPREVILNFHQVLARSAREQLEKLTERNTGLRRLWEVADLVLATIHGIIADRLITDPRGFDAIDDYDCREWLMKHGASQRSANSAFLRALYDLAFAYEDGDLARPGIAAGQALRGAVRAFFTYRGAFFWKMQAGMGDVVFAPFYEVL